MSDSSGRSFKLWIDAIEVYDPTRDEHFNIELPMPVCVGYEDSLESIIERANELDIYDESGITLDEIQPLLDEIDQERQPPNTQ